MDKDNSIIKVLQVNASTKGYGGVSAILFNIYKNINKEKIQFDFISPKKTTYEIHRKEIEKMGGHLYELNVDKNKIINKILIHKRLSKFLKENKYDIIHINSGSYFFNLQIAMIAKLSGIKRIIVHSHNTLNPNNKIANFLVKVFKPVLNVFATDFFACSKMAAEDMFSKKIANEKAIIIKNGINLEKFKFDNEIRKKIRNEMNLENQLVIGNVGRFVQQKNQEFLIECFNEILKVRKDSILLLIGQGELEDELKNKVKMLKIEKNVKFLGLREDVNELMQAMDVFVLPSLFEGFGIVGLEAQTAGLFTVVSTAIPDNLNVTDNIIYLDLKKGSKHWADTILNKQLEYDRRKFFEEVKKHEYDIKNTAEKLEKIYKNEGKECDNL